jgi:hypothetical protein
MGALLEIAPESVLNDAACACPDTRRADRAPGSATGQNLLKNKPDDLSGCSE